ncbi:MAG: PKD domain-containing protein [Thermoplasmatota archaeon]
MLPKTFLTLMVAVLMGFSSIISLEAGSSQGIGVPDGAIPTRAPGFTNVSISAGLAGYRGDNLAWGDYNNDGDLDLLVRGPSSNYLFKNNGPPNWDFTDVSNDTGVNVSRGYSQWADYNGDGYLDFYTAGDDDHLFRNNGPPNWDFTDMTQQAGNPSDGLPSEGIGWGDYNRDGFPDIFTVGWRKPGDLQWPYPGEMDRLYRNNGDGTFTDVSLAVGLNPRETSYAGMGMAWCDPNEDGWPDIYVCNYHLTPNQLWINQRDGTFIDMAPEYNLTGKATVYQGTTYYGHCNGAGWADFDNDRDMDIWVSHLAHKDDERSGMNRGYYCADSQLFENSGPPYLEFNDIRIRAGIPITPSGTVVQDPDSGDLMWKDEDYFGVAWGDCDNDGDLDLWVPQVKTYSFWDHSFLWENDGDRTFTDSTDSSGLKVWSNTGGTWVDYDNDGDLDFCTEGTYPFRGPRELHLFRNPGNSNHWLELELRGAGGNRQSSTDAIGAKAVLQSGSTTLTRYVGGDCGGHGFQQPLRLHFGLGSRTSIDSIFIYWPSGRIQKYDDPPIDGLLTINEPETSYLDLSSNGFEFEVIEDETASISTSHTGPGISSRYWDLDNDRDFETMVPSPDQDITYYGQGKHWLRYRVKDVNGYFWDLEPISINVTNIPPGISLPETLDLVEEEAYTLDLEPFDTPSDLANLTIEWRIDPGGSWIRGEGVREISFEDMGQYTVSARATDDDGEQAERSVSIEVENRMPEVQLETEQTEIREDEVCELRATASDSSLDMENMKYRFYSGDGRSTGWIDENSTYFLYQKNGTFRAAVEVKDRHGEIASDMLYVTVQNMLPVVMFRDIDNETEEDTEVVFQVVGYDSNSDNDGLKYRMDFDDGLGWTQWKDLIMSEHQIPGFSLWETYMEVRHTFTSSGMHMVKLQVKDDDEAVTEKTFGMLVMNVLPTAEIRLPDQPLLYEDVSFVLTAEISDTISDEDALEHKWVFSDGTETEWSEEEPYVEHVFRDIGYGGKWVSLLVRDDDDEINVTQSLGVKSLPPRADLSVGQRTVLEDETVMFDAGDSTDTVSDVDTLEFTWKIDGIEVPGNAVMRHTFHYSGMYRIDLRVEDNDGGGDEESVMITVTNQAPTLEVTIHDEVIAGELFDIDATETFDTPSDLRNLTFTYEFDDDSDPLETGLNLVNHTYGKPGTYTIVVRVSDGDESATFEHEVSVLAKEQPGKEKSNGAVWVILAMVLVLILLGFGAATAYVLISRKQQADQARLGPPVPPPYLQQQQFRGQFPQARPRPLPQAGPVQLIPRPTGPSSLPPAPSGHHHGADHAQDNKQ